MSIKSRAVSNATMWTRYMTQPKRINVPALMMVLVVLGSIALSFASDRRPSFAEKPVALRFVVISGGTRIASLYRLLSSVCLVLNEGDRLDLDVWFDIPEGVDYFSASAELKQVTSEIVQLRRNGTYRHGQIRAHIWHQHMGLRGQWLEAWHMSIPGGLHEDTREIGLILEDDLELSPYSWRWLKAAFEAYGDDERVAGFTLQRAGLCLAKCPNIEIGGPENAGGAFFYPLVGTWGYAPTAKSFTRFRAWMQSLPADFKPYVDGLTPTDWYKNFDKKGTAKQRMWTMHHIKYTDTHVDRYTVYPRYGGNFTFSANHREAGLNFDGHQKQGPVHELLTEWDPAYIQFAKNPYIWNYSAVVTAGEGLGGGIL